MCEAIKIKLAVCSKRVVEQKRKVKKIANEQKLKPAIIIII
jgi:hypothetical protein